MNGIGRSRAAWLASIDLSRHAKVYPLKTLYRHSRATAVEAALRTALLAAPSLCGLAIADVPPDPVRWTAAIASQETIHQGTIATLEVSGAIAEGWHVYALEQLPHGPTALRVTLDPTDLATVAGASTATPALKEYSTSFGLETHYYSHTFVVRLPVRLNAVRDNAQRGLPLSVRFQACSDRECLLPRTLHLEVPLKAQTVGEAAELPVTIL